MATMARTARSSAMSSDFRPRFLLRDGSINLLLMKSCALRDE